MTGSVSADYLKHYWDGREAFRNRKYRESVVFLDRAIELQPQGGERVRWTGTHVETYLPHFHLARALNELELYGQAAREWNESVRQGKILEKANKRQYRELQEELERIRTERFRETLERMRRELAATDSYLQAIKTRGIGGLVSDSDLEQAALLLDGARNEVSGAGDGDFAPLEQAIKSMDEARSRMLQSLDAAERLERERQGETNARRLDEIQRAALEVTEQLASGACLPEAISRLQGFMDGNAAAAEPSNGPDPLLLLLARAFEQCGDGLGAEQYLQLARQRPGGDDASLRERQLLLATERRRAGVGRTLRGVDEKLDRGGCETSSIAMLEDLRARDLSSGSEGGLPLDVRLARSYLACGMTGEAGVALERARVSAAASTDAISDLEKQLNSATARDDSAARAELTREFERRSVERALSSHLSARARIDLRGCDRDAIAEMEAALPSLAGSRNLPATEPHLDLARAYRACGDREQTRRHLELALRRREGSAGETDQLRDWLTRTQVLDIYSESHALIVGVAHYEAEAWGQLPEVIDDVDQVEALLQDHGFAVQKLIDPTSAELRKRLEGFFRKKRPRDSRLVFYYGGHGHTEINDFLRLGYIVPADTPFPRTDDDATYLNYLISMDGFEQFATGTSANHAMFLFDSCFSGTIFDVTSTRFRMGSRPAAERGDRLSQPVRLFITAGDETQMVPAESAFRAAVVRALEGFADEDVDGLILGAEVGSFVAEHGASSRNTPQWGMLEIEGFDSGELAFHVPDFAGPPATGAGVAAELALWQLVEESDNPDDLRRYLDRYPTGRFAGLAGWILERFPEDR